MAHIKYPTDSFACDRAMKKTLVEGLAEDQRPLLREIFQRADSLVAAMRLGPCSLTVAIQEFDAFCAAQKCLPWIPEDPTRHVIVRIYGLGLRVISVNRAMWACVHVVSAQGPQLTSDEELSHKCEMNGTSGTGYGACLNPAHFIRGDRKLTNQLKLVRARLDKIYARAGL